MTNLEQVKDFFKNDKFATELTGIEIIDVDDHYAKCIINLTDQHLNAAQNVMGGVLFTLADFTFAVAANFNNPITVTTSSQISFLSRVKGKQLICEAKCMKDGLQNSFYFMEIKDELDTLIAVVTANGFKR